MKLEISLFKFDYKSDYLPYYTKHFIKIKDEETMLDVLNTINSDKSFAYENCENFNIIINGIYMPVSTSIKDVVSNFGKDINIEPISIRRSHSDLLINDADFQERLAVLADFIEDEDIAKYNSYKIYFYASNTINYEYDYIGDPILLLAYDLIEKNKENEKDILKAIQEHDCGADYHTSLEKRVLDFDYVIEEKINSIKKRLEITKEIKEQNFELNKKQNIDFGTFLQDEIKHDFNEFNLAYYKGLKQDIQTEELLTSLSAKIIDTQNMYNDLAKDTFHMNSDFSLKLASAIILDAFDNDADLLIVDNDEDFKIFDSNRKILKELSGREIILPVIHKNELAQLAYGQHDEVRKNLEKHSVNPEII